MIDYKQSGVNIEEGYRAVNSYKASSKRTSIPGVLSGLGSFAGMFEVPPGMKNPVMVSGTDGVGTKLDIAFSMRKYDTVGIDCVAMSVNDILCTGARPLYFLDYIACGKLDAAVAADLVKGVADGCIDAGCALLGGETAEMPGFYDEGKYDIAGFGVGIAERSEIIDGTAIRSGDVLIGLTSSGVHSNGFSLVRKLVSDFDTPFETERGVMPIGKALLEPTRIYVRPVLAVLEKFKKPDGSNAVHGMAHITGGGFYENIPRMYADKHFVSEITKGSWQIPAVFAELTQRGADPDSMFNTFNMGIGFVLAVDAAQSDEVIAAFNAFGASKDAGSCAGMRAAAIGKVKKSEKEAKEQKEAVIFC